MPEVWFIRHGESIANANLRTKDPALSPLTAKGEAEAALVPLAFGERQPSLIVSSSYVRAQQTAVPTRKQFPTVPHETWPVHEFTYLAPHRYDGSRMSDRAAFSKAFWQQNDPHFKDEGQGESLAECLGRIDALKTRLQNHEAPFIAIFCHGLFIRLLLIRLFSGTTDIPADAVRRTRHLIRAVAFPNCGICVTQFNKSGQFSFSNIQTEHLRELRENSPSRK